MLNDAVAAFLAAGILIIVGVLALQGKDAPAQFWGFLGTAVGYFFRGGVDRRAGRKRKEP